jgi:predicted nucleic acid-binding protein
MVEMLPKLFDDIVIPPAVLKEVQSSRSTFKSVDLAKYPWLQVRAPADAAQVKQLLVELDRGEAEAIALALELQAEILIDETDGREVARRLGLRRIGALGVLLRLKSRGLIARVLPLVDRLQAELNFFISPDLRAQIKLLASE